MFRDPVLSASLTMEYLKRQGARVHNGGKAKYGCKQMRNYAQSAADRCKDACATSLCQASGDGENHASTRNEHDDE